MKGCEIEQLEYKGKKVKSYKPILDASQIVSKGGDIRLRIKNHEGISKTYEVLRVLIEELGVLKKGAKIKSISNNNVVLELRDKKLAVEVYNKLTGK